VQEEPERQAKVLMEVVVVEVQMTVVVVVELVNAVGLVYLDKLMEVLEALD
jgi:hypothetical protein